MDINGYSDAQKLKRVPAYLKGEARQWVNTILFLEPELNWSTFKVRFMKGFCENMGADLFRKKLKDARQTLSEPPTAYLVRIVDICREFRSNMSERDIVSELAEGMTSSTFNMLSGLKPRREWSISWIMEIMTRYRPELTKSSSSADRRALPSSSKQPESKDLSTWVCFNCSQTGHLSKNCPQPRDEKRLGEMKAEYRTSKQKERERNNPTSTTRSIHNLECRQDGTHSVEFACDALIKPFLSLELNGQEFVGRLDTGADLTTIPRNIAEQLNLCVMPNSELALSGFGNHRIEVDGIASVIVAYGGKKRAILVAVASDAKAKPIWGLDIIHEFSIVRIPTFEPHPETPQRSKEVLCLENRTVHPLDKLELGPTDEATTLLVKEALVHFGDVFSRDDLDIGRTKTLKHEIRLNDTQPVNKRPYRVPVRDRPFLEQTIKRLLETGAIRPSTSPFSSPCFFVEKDHGESKRLVVDYRALNSKTILDRMPMPHPEDVFSQLAGAKVFAKLDIKAMFNQIEISEEDIPKTAFSTSFGLFECPLMPFGLVNAPATAVRLMREVLRDLDGKSCYVYFDDIIVYAEDPGELIQRCCAVFERLRHHNLKLNPGKCKFVTDSVHFLGHIISSKGVEIDPRRVEQVKKFPVPRNPSDVRSFHGLCSYNRKFIRDFAKIAKPLTQLMGKPSDFVWSVEAQGAFEKLRDALVSAPILVHFNHNAKHELRTDASSFAIGAILYQIHDDPEQTGTVLYYSKTLSKAQRNYSATERELLAAFQSITELRHYLIGKEFTLVTDHAALSLIHNRKDPHHRLARWVAQLQCYTFNVVYKSGAKHQDADCMSRLVTDDLTEEERTEEASEDTIRAVYQVTRQNLEDPTGEDESHLPLGTLVDIRAEQREDTYCKKFIDILESDATDLEKSVKAKNFMMQDDQLYRLSANNAPTLVIPACRRGAIMLSFHDFPLAGHLGFSRTYINIKKRYFWPKMRRDIKHHVASCLGCQKRKASNRRRQGFIRPLPIAEDVFDTVGIDLITKLPRSHNGYNTILVCTDNLSKYVVTAPLKDEKAETIIHAFFNSVISKHGCPRVVISDRGANISGEASRDFFRLFGIKRHLTSAYHPQSNGQTERFNRTLAASLTIYVDKHQKTWSDYVQALTFAYNISEHSVTRVTPYELIFHRRPRVPIDNVLERSEFVDPSRPEPGSLSSETVNKMKQYIMQNQMANKKRLDARLSPSEFKEGDLVLVERPTRVRGTANKLQYQYIGPYKVLEKISDLSFKIGFLSGRPHSSTVHPCHLRRYIQRQGEVLDDCVEPDFVPLERPEQQDEPGEGPTTAQENPDLQVPLAD